MEAEERPSKIRKLNYEDVREEQSPNGHPTSPKSDPGDETSRSAPVSNSQDDLERRTSVQSNDEGHGDCQNEQQVSHSLDNADQESQKPLSKSQLKKMRRREQWEAGREYRKVVRKQKNKERKERKRTERDEQASKLVEEDGDPSGELKPAMVITSKKAKPTLLPVTLLIDCGFETLMGEREIVSLGSQITRCYAMNNQAPFRSHLIVSSFSGQLKNRFETVLTSQHKSWKGVRFFDEDFLRASEIAKEQMCGPMGGELAGSFSSSTKESDNPVEAGEVVYLTSESPDTLQELKPYSTYIIGGLVDRNRHKGICYKRAMDNGMKTAKLPIGQYMQMNSRYVLTTNHVVEIILEWLDCRDWGKAFMAVMPKRKGAALKDTGATAKDADADLEEQEGTSRTSDDVEVQV